MNGKTVDILQSGYQEIGEYTITWNANDQPSGVYFVQFNSGGNMQSNKLLLLK